MKNDVKTLAKDLRSNINWLLFEEINFNQDLFAKYGTSPFEIQLAKELPETDASREGKLILAEENYQKLINSEINNVSEECIWLLSFSHTMACKLIDGCISDNHDRLHPMKMLIESSIMMGKALAIIHAPSLVTDAKNYYKNIQRKPQSIGGKKGAESKHALTNKLKYWAIEQSQFDNNRADKAFAREIRKKIPEELREASSDPERFIYESIREAIKEREIAGK